MSFVPESGKGRGCGVVAAAVLALALPATAALADDTGGTLKLNFGNDSFNWLVGQDGQTEFTDDGYVFSGNDYGSGWNMNWEVMSSGSEFIQSITATFSIINTSSACNLNCQILFLIIYARFELTSFRTLEILPCFQSSYDEACSA